MASSQQQQQLLMQKEAFAAYLQPLLKQHEANQVLTYEDLTASWQAAIGVLGRLTADAASKKTVREKLTALHQSQVRAYRDAAGRALLQWADAVSLPEINSTLHDSVAAYQKSCRAVTAATLPAWRNVNGTQQLRAAYNRIDERAAELYNNNINSASLKQSEKVDNDGGDDDGDNDDEEGEIEEGEEEEEEGVIDEGEEDDNDTEREEGEEGEESKPPPATKKVNNTTTSTPGAKGKKDGILAKRKAASKTKTVNNKNNSSKKPNAAAAAANRGRRGRSRGGGRGGGGNVK